MGGRDIRLQVAAAFTIGLLGGGGTVGLLMLRQEQADHQYAQQMNQAAQMANSSNRSELIRSHELATMALTTARKAEKRALNAELRLRSIERDQSRAIDLNAALGRQNDNLAR